MASMSFPQSVVAYIISPVTPLLDHGVQLKNKNNNNISIFIIFLDPAIELRDDTEKLLSPPQMQIIIIFRHIQIINKRLVYNIIFKQSN